jgi:Protein of unknown function (DUF1559).
MNDPTENDIEKLLRNAPQPVPPGDLKERLIMKARDDERRFPSNTQISQVQSGWLRHLWPVLIPSGICLFCVIGLSVQQSKIQSLENEIATLRQTLTNELNLTTSPVNVETPTGLATDRAKEIAELREIAERLKQEIAERQKLQLENREIQQTLKKRSGLFSEEIEADANARERAQEIACVNNMKQMALAVLIWAQDNESQLPPNVICMSNELSTTRILVCPGDRSRQPAPDFGSFSMENCSYEWFLDIPGSIKKGPFSMLTRCPIHGNVGLVDGSVHMRIAKEHPEWLKLRDGKWFLERPATQENNP